MSLFRFTAGSLAVLFLVSALAAAELKMKNGDRITGEIVSRADGKIKIKTALFGTLEVAESAVESIAIAQGKAPEPKKEASPKPAQPGEAQRPEEVRVVAGAAAAAKPRLQRIMVGIPGVLPLLQSPVGVRLREIVDGTKGNVQFGLTDQTGRRKSVDVSFIGNAEYVTESNNYRVNGRYLYGRAEGQVVTDRREATFRWRHDLKRHIFSQTVTTYNDDAIKLIDLNLEQSVGLGVTAYRKHGCIFNVGAGFTSQYRKLQEYESGTVVLGDFFEDVTYKITDRISFKQEGSAQYSPVSRASYVIVNGAMLPATDEASNYRFKLNAALQSKISSHLSVNLRYDFEFDNTIGEQGLKADQRITSTIGYDF